MLPQLDNTLISTGPLKVLWAMYFTGTSGFVHIVVSYLVGPLTPARFLHHAILEKVGSNVTCKEGSRKNSSASSTPLGRDQDP